MLQGEHSAILLTFIKLPFVIKIFVLSVFKWPLKTGFTVTVYLQLVQAMPWSTPPRIDDEWKKKVAAEMLASLSAGRLVH